MNHCEFAIKLATNRSTHATFKHGAVLIKGKEVVSFGFNNQRHHAEVKAILGCMRMSNKRYMRKCILLVVRHNMGNSKQCARCLKMIRDCGIKKIYYSCDRTLVRAHSSRIQTSHLSARYRK